MAEGMEDGGDVIADRRFRILLAFGISDLILGIGLVFTNHRYAGVALLIIGSILTATSFSKAGRRTSHRPGIRLSHFAYQYAFVASGFFTLAVVLLGVAISSASHGDTGKCALAAVGGVLSLALAIGAAFSVIAARRIAAGRAGRIAIKWLPGWRLFIQEPSRGEQREPAGDDSAG